jgi:thymus-specific serine protease
VGVASWRCVCWWQTCTEFAYYQTCDPGTACPYTTGLNTLQYNLEQCQVAFNMSTDIPGRAVNVSNAYWGSDWLQGSRILFPNGQIDPWHYLGVLQSPNALEPVRVGVACVVLGPSAV